MDHASENRKSTCILIAMLVILVLAGAASISATEPLFRAPVEYFRYTTGYLAIDDNGDIYTTTGQEIGILVNDGTGDYRSSHYTPGTTVSWFGPITAADLNGDGRTDLALANGTSLSVVMGGGRGILSGVTDYYVGASQTALIAEDLDGDGDIDLAGVSSDGAIILVNDGLGAFDSTVVYTTSRTLTNLAGSDLDGDGDIDFIATARESNLIVILANRGNGVFESESEYPAGNHPQAAVAGDLDGDGDIDIAIANNGSDNVSVLPGNGDGTFGPALFYAVGSQPTALCLIDLRNDGLMDLAVASSSAATVSLLNNDGNGAFDEELSYEVLPYPSSIAAEDINGDGFEDVVFAGGHGRISAWGVSILFADLEGQLMTAPIYQTGSGSFPRVANVNRDVYPDLLHSSGSLLGHGDGTFYPGPPIPDSALGAPICPFDVDGDGDDDLARWIEDSSVVEVLVNDGQGVFGEPVTYSIVGAASYIEAGDLDGNGTLDLVLAHSYWGVTVVLNVWGTLFPDTTKYFAGYSVPNQGFPLSIRLADIDRDNDLDIIASGAFQGPMPPSSVGILRNNGDGTFAEPVYYAPWPAIPTWPYGYELIIPVSVAVGNIDGDGDLDLIFSIFGVQPKAPDGFYDAFSILRNYGNGHFSSPIAYSSERPPPYLGTLAALDIDDDHDVDIVMGDTPLRGIAVWLNRGPGIFDAPIRSYGLPLVNPYSQIDWADFDQDGDLDLAVSSGGSVGILINRTRSPLSAVTEEDTPDHMPQTYSLAPNYPNPFNPSTTIRFDLPRRSVVALEVFNILGQKVRTLVSETLPAGAHQVRWHGRGDDQKPVASGVYFYRLKSDDFVVARKMVLLK